MDPNLRHIKRISTFDVEGKTRGHNGGRKSKRKGSSREGKPNARKVTEGRMTGEIGEYPIPSPRGRSRILKAVREFVRHSIKGGRGGRVVCGEGVPCWRQKEGRVPILREYQGGD